MIGPICRSRGPNGSSLDQRIGQDRIEGRDCRGRCPKTSHCPIHSSWGHSRHCPLEFPHPPGMVCLACTVSEGTPLWHKSCCLSEPAKWCITTSNMLQWQDRPFAPYWQSNHHQAISVHSILQLEDGRIGPKILPTWCSASLERRRQPRTMAHGPSWPRQDQLHWLYFHWQEGHGKCLEDTEASYARAVSPHVFLVTFHTANLE